MADWSFTVVMPAIRLSMVASTAEEQVEKLKKKMYKVTQTCFHELSIGILFILIGLEVLHFLLSLLDPLKQPIVLHLSGSEINIQGASERKGKEQ